MYTVYQSFHNKCLKSISSQPLFLELSYKCLINIFSKNVRIREFLQNILNVKAQTFTWKYLVTQKIGFK